ncbi:MAG: MBL fold metallo-hydrolase, partial [Gammaproteobacteria bacterium]
MSALKIADRWFERRRVSDDITFLWEPHVHRFIRCNIWHVRGRDADLLVDTGLGMASLKDHLADMIDKPLLAVATHYHYDHVGSLHEFDARLIHREEAAAMSDYHQPATLLLSDFPQLFIDAMREAGLPADGEALVSAVPHEGYALEGF